MTERQRNIAIGLFVLGGFLALAILVLLFGAFPNVISGGTYSVGIIFQSEVEDIPVDTDVFMLGKRIGRVTKVQWLGGRPSQAARDVVEINGVKATVEIEEHVDIPRNAIATFKEAAIGFGRSRVQIKVPLGVPTEYLVKNGTATMVGQVIGPFEQIIPKKMGVTLEKAATQIGGLAEALTPAAKDIHQLLKPVSLEKINSGEAVGNLSSALQRLDTALANINDVIGKPQVKQDIIVTVSNVREASEQLKGAIADVKAFAKSARATAENAETLPKNIRDLLDNAQGRIDSIAQHLIANSNSIEEVLQGVNKAVNEMNQGKGTLGNLVYNNKLVRGADVDSPTHGGGHGGHAVADQDLAGPGRAHREPQTAIAAGGRCRLGFRPYTILWSRKGRPGSMCQGWCRPDTLPLLRAGVVPLFGLGRRFLRERCGQGAAGEKAKVDTPAFLAILRDRAGGQCQRGCVLRGRPDAPVRGLDARPSLPLYQPATQTVRPDPPDCHR